ncbi:MAG: hypothetical protein P8164_04975 [Gammaproteobacteria bacterium]
MPPAITNTIAIGMDGDMSTAKVTDGIIANKTFAITVNGCRPIAFCQLRMRW